MADQDPASALIARTAPGVTSIESPQWDACAGRDDPFLSHTFLAALEESGSVGPGTGWQASPILIDGPDGAPVGCLPAYLKGHSQGEYVFDHAWADAWARAGGHYYPKLQIAVPFTPVTGRRLLFRDDAAPEIASGLIGAAEQLVSQHGLSSAHATFVAPEEIPLFEAAGWLVREDSQFHFDGERGGNRPMGRIAGYSAVRSAGLAGPGAAGDDQSGMGIQSGCGREQSGSVQPAGGVDHSGGHV